MLEREGGLTVRVASSSRRPCVPLHGGQSVLPDVALPAGVRAEEYAAVIFPGGYTHEFKDDSPSRPVVRRLMADMLARGKCVAALGHGLGVPAAAGLLAGRRVANHDQLRGWLGDGGAVWVNEPVVADGPLVTGRDSAAAAAFARRVLQILRGEKAIGP